MLDTCPTNPMTIFLTTDYFSAECAFVQMEKFNAFCIIHPALQFEIDAYFSSGLNTFICTFYKCILRSKICLNRE